MLCHLARMIIFDAHRVKLWLEQRDVKVRPPASHAMLARLSEVFAGQGSFGLVRMYEAFDGFDDGDFEASSFISIWPLTEVLRYSSSEGLRGQLAFADWSFTSDVALCDITNPDEPVSWRDGCKPSATSLVHFWRGFMAGELRD